MVNVALPAIRRELGGGLGVQEWVLDGYLLTLSALLLLGGALGDRYGRRRIFLAGLTVFALASLACGMAPDSPVLIAARPVIEGAASGIVGSGAFNNLFRLGVRDLHRGIFKRDRNTVVLTVAQRKNATTRVRVMTTHRVQLPLSTPDFDGPLDAIHQACLLRFRPIMMTTMAALFGGLPLALGVGAGSELRRPLGIAIVGGLIVSQTLTLYTTPVIYLYLERLSQWLSGGRKVRHEEPARRIAAE